MTQKFYWHDATTTNTGIMPSTNQSATSPTITATGASTARAMTGSIGGLQVGPTLASNGSRTKQNNWWRTFVSPPLQAITIPVNSTWELRAAIKVNTGTNSLWNISAIVYTWRPSTGARITTIIDAVTTGIGTSASTSETDTSVALITGAGAAVTILDGDILVIEVWGTVTQTNTTSRTWTLYYDGTTEGSTTSNAAYLLAPQDLPLLTGIISDNRSLMGVGN
jgi:hypothetical protein